jgi:ribosomal protein S27E
MHKYHDWQEDEQLETGEAVTLVCTGCGHVTTMPGGFKHVETWICSECGETVTVGDRPVQ